MSKYPVIVFEGIEASGKSTNLKIVSNYLKNNNKKFIKLREPGGVKTSEKLRKLVLNNKSQLNSKTDFLIILASRSENMDKLIKKYHKKRIILIDRFTDSTIAYQHYGMNFNKKLIMMLNSFIIGKFKPDLTILSTVNKSNMFLRLKKRKNKNKYDKFNFKFYDKVQKGFIKISKFSKKYLILNSNIYNRKDSKKIIIKKIDKLIK